ncbi:helix-turn-helix domain-containing protein [Marinagarivorans algicola]|uniref:helix-turn-helix domain-containing protein n=1 Tax=Marinagarivorans algicola TaxID=1513270 RepID=UPI0006B587B7|nr:helix-turn-helix domain-containing protein [Marinagarivorans algicola]
MSHLKTVLLNRAQLKQMVTEQAIKHIWLANEIGVSEKTLTRWLKGDVIRIRIHNLNKLALALKCPKEDLIATSETDAYPSEKNRDLLIDELSSDGFLYELMMSSKINLTVSLIKSTFHPRLPSAIMADFYIKLGYASLIHRQYKKAIHYLTKGLNKATSVADHTLMFSANLGLAITWFFHSELTKAHVHLTLCKKTIEYAGQEKAHFYSTFALYELYCGHFDDAMEAANACLNECLPGKPAIEKNVFKSTALQVLAACYVFQGDLDAAHHVCIESLSVANQSGYKRSVAVSKGYLAAIYCVRGDFEYAEQLIEQSLLLVNPEDISMPSLLGIAAYITHSTNNVTQYHAYQAEINTICPANTVIHVFASYLMFARCQEQGSAQVTTVPLSDLDQALDRLGLTYWQRWLHKRYA